MAQQDINIGTTANDGTGDQLRTAFDKTNQNFTDLYDTLVADIYSGIATVVRTTAPATLIGVITDVPGMIAFDATSVYVCVGAWDGTNPIWIQLNTDAAVDHNNIANVGTNDHATIDTHLAATDIHFTQADILTVINTLPAGNNYELVLGDSRALVRTTDGAANTVTIPADSAVSFPIGTVIEVTMAGAGVATIQITTDTLNGVTVLAQNDVVKLTKVAATEWLAS